MFDLPNAEDQWYFAYGSNLSIDRKQDRTGAIRRTERVRLAGYRLTFNKRSNKGDQVYANIIPDAESEVWGVAYCCNPDAFSKLDHCEGVSGGHYRRVSLQVEARNGTTFTATTYIAGDDHIVEEQAPRDGYLQLIVDGAREHKLPADYITMIKDIAGRCEEQ